VIFNLGRDGFDDDGGKGSFEEESLGALAVEDEERVACGVREAAIVVVERGRGTKVRVADWFFGCSSEN
tara:strand:+ start:394 stop:600 length:207 start_codon:yes stop_codon:yes gene_type:complete